MLTIGAAALADEPAAAPAGPTIADMLAASGITTTGYVAASYFHSNELNSYHNYDVGHDTFQLDEAGITVAYQPKEGFGGVVNIIAGEDARLQNSFESPGTDSSVEVLQAYLQYATGGLTVIAGKYTTLAGAEVIAPSANTNFSRSLLFTFEPAVHTGIRATYAVNDMFSVTGGVNNGWNYDSTSYGSKTGEVAVSFTPSKAFILTAQGYFGKDPNLDGSRKLIDLVATWNATDALQLILSYDWGKQENVSTLTVNGSDDAKWNGAALYVNYKFSDAWRISVRGEYFDDKEGLLTGADQKLKEVTLTLGYAPTTNFELRFEGRKDKSDESTFARVSPTDLPTDKQTEFAIQGVFHF
jgi:hypothetical protein